ncbi:MAG: helix-turn-helix transcriptional regulator [Chloroflexota bacterium]
MPTRIRQRHAAPESTALRQLGQRLREARVAAALSQAQLGAPYYTRAHVSAIELGKIRPTMKSLEHMATKLGRPASYFMEDRQLEEQRGERAVAIARAHQLTAQGKAAEAISILTPLLELEQTRLERAGVLRALGRAHWEAGHGAKSAVALQEALDIYQANGNAELIARTRAQLGMALHLLMSYAEAAEHFSEALRAMARGELRDPVLKVHVLHNLGLTFYQRNEFSLALEHFERAESDGADIADPKWLASLLAAIGMSFHQLKDYDAALAYLGKSEALFESIRNRSRVAEIRFQRGRSLLAIGHRRKGIETLREAERLAREADNPALETRIAMIAGLTQVEDGDEEGGIASLRSAHSRAGVLGDRALSVATAIALARSVKRLDTKEAEQVLRATVEMMQDRPGPELGETYAELSDVLSRRGLAEEALGYSRRAFELSRR